MAAPGSAADLVALALATSDGSVSDAAIVAVLSERLAHGVPYTWASATNLVCVNPYRENDALDAEFSEQCSVYHDIASMEPHPCALAVRAYHRMLRVQQSQSILYHGATDAGKSHAMQLVTEHLLMLAASQTPEESLIADQVRCAQHIIGAFGAARTAASERASRHATYLEMHFTATGRLSGAKLLAYGLDKHRLGDTVPGERTYSIFYQFFGGATREEREAYRLDGVPQFALFPKRSLPTREDARACEWTRSAFASLGLKEKHVQGIFCVLSAVLHLSNLTFADADVPNSAACITSHDALERAAAVLQVAPSDLAQSLVMDTCYLQNERITHLLDHRGAAMQRDGLVRNLYALLFAFVVEVINQKLAPATGTAHPLQIVQFDPPGFVARGEVKAPRASHFDDLVKNYMAELFRAMDLHACLDAHAGVNQALVDDGIRVPHTAKYRDVMPLLRGSPPDAAIPAQGSVAADYATAFSQVLHGQRVEDDDGALLDSLYPLASEQSFHPIDSCRGVPAYGIDHAFGTCAYSVLHHQRSEVDLFATEQFQLLRSSASPFITRLVAGPGMAIDSHLADRKVVLRAQISSRPLRRPTQLGTCTLFSSTGIAGVFEQLDATVVDLVRMLHATDTTWRVFCLCSNDMSQPNAFDTRRVTQQVRAAALPQLVQRMQHSWLAPIALIDFCQRYEAVLHATLGEAVMAAADERGQFLEFACLRGWSDPGEFVLGATQVCLAYASWYALEEEMRTFSNARGIAGDTARASVPPNPFGLLDEQRYSGASYTNPSAETHSTDFYGTKHQTFEMQPDASQTSLLKHDTDPEIDALGLGEPIQPTNGSWGPTLITEKDVLLEATSVEEVPIPKMRKCWTAIVWAITFWIPDSVLKYIGKMKRPDVRMAWREKLAICVLIGLFCGLILFYIIGLGRILCPEYDKAWNAGQLGEHSDGDSYYVAVHGNVYDLTKFYKMDHSDIKAMPVTNDSMMELAGQDLTAYFPVPLVQGCPGLVQDVNLELMANENLTATLGQAVHKSGAAQTYSDTKLNSPSWYFNRFLPKMKPYFKGYYVFSNEELQTDGSWRKWAVVDGRVYDLTNYLFTANQKRGDDKYTFLNQDVVDLFDAQSGSDITADFSRAMAALPPTVRHQTQQCLDRTFYLGRHDFRETARCEAQNYLLLSFSILIFISIFAKFVSALQLARRPTPELQDRFVICHIPCYTEGEDSLRKTIDSLAVQQYDDKRKLLFIVCDGMITGSGNEKPTPRIVLDILGVDPLVDPEPLPFKSVAEGSKQLNYGKVHSGLYECEGHMVPFIVVVKVGRPSERSKPGNRGKRDTQVLLMRYLNNMHFDLPMCPLELEIYHHMKNVIGVDPAFYEYVLMVDADTTIMADGMNRLVAAACHDHSIIAVCGETLLENEDESVWTMIQVYEYYISHNLAKAFESLFGSVTCLPGCFTMYRIRSTDKGRPLLVSNKIIDDYAVSRIDTLHKKNLLALGEDRYLTTLLLKHFPSYRTKFRVDAKALTTAPSHFSVLLSQRRRWINSTVHNLVELVRMDGLCGFCLFSMRFIVFIDLVGTVILPATAVYMVYLIVTVATGAAPLPIIALAMIGAVYGLQAIVFLLRRQWQYIGWMVIYLMAYPVYAFLLPIYSFWHMDDFTWGSTRIVVGEKGNRKVVAGTDDEPYHDSMIPKKRFSEYQQEMYALGDAFDDPLLFGDASAARAAPIAAPDFEYTDYFQETNVLDKRASRSLPRTSRYDARSHGATPMDMHSVPMPAMSMYGMPPMYGTNPWGTPFPATRPMSGISALAHPLSSMGHGAVPETDASDPSDETLRAAIISYLAAQPSLMHVTKRHVREAIGAAMPNADLARRRGRINRMVDELLSGGRECTIV